MTHVSGQEAALGAALKPMEPADAKHLYDKLARRLEHEQQRYRKSWNAYDNLNKLTLLLVLLSSLGATVAGLSQQAFVAGVLSAITTALIVARQTFALAPRVMFYARHHSSRGQFQITHSRTT
jgi:hypothetical protein